MTSVNHLVSVILPVFNSGHLLKITLGSVAQQTYPNFELITVDDGSTDGSAEVLDSFSKNFSMPMKVLRHAGGKRRGISETYRLALERCRGNIIAFLDHDDYWSENKISQQIKVFDKFPEVGVVFSDVYICDERGRVGAKPFKGFINRPPIEKPFSAFSRLLWGNYLLTFSNIMVRRNLIKQSDFIAEPEGFQDWMLLLLLSSRCKFHHCTSTKTFWRQHSDSYYGKLKQLPNYFSLNSELRKSALTCAMERILSEKESSASLHLHPNKFIIRYWLKLIPLLSLTQVIADYLRRILNLDRGLSINTR